MLVVSAALGAALLVRTREAGSRFSLVVPASRSEQGSPEPSALALESATSRASERAGRAPAGGRVEEAPERSAGRVERLAGHVADVHTGFPVAGATVEISLGDARVSCEAADDGAFETEALVLPARAANATFVVTTPLDERFELERRAEGTEWCALRLEVEASYEVRGTLVDAADRPVEGGVAAIVDRVLASRRVPRASATTDASGTFVLRFPTADPLERTALVVCGPSSAVREQPVVLDRLRIDLGRLRVVEEGVTITGRVVGTSDLSVARSVLAIDLRGRDDPFLYASDVLLRWNGERVYRDRVEVPVGEHGTFEIRGLRPGPYALQLGKDVRCDYGRGVGGVDVEAPARGVELVDGSAVLLVEVADARGEALDLARLQFAEERRMPCQAYEGLVDIALPAGELEATVTCPGYLSFDLRLALEAGTVHRTSVVLAGQEATGDLVVSVVDADGRIPPRTTISVLWRSDAESEPVSVREQIEELTEAGILLRKIPAGELLVRVNPNTFVDDYSELTLAAERTVELDPDEIERVELVCGFGGHVRVAVHDSDGELLTARLRWVGQDPTLARTFLPEDRTAVYVGFNGGAVCRTKDPMPPGTWRLEASADGRRAVSRDVLVVAGETVDVELLLPPDDR